MSIVSTVTSKPWMLILVGVLIAMFVLPRVL